MIRPYTALSRWTRRAAALAALLALGAAPAAAAPAYLLFESGPVRPVALTPDGAHLLVTNVPDGRLEIFDVTTGGLQAAGDVQVGLEPVAVAVRNNNEAWVVNHLSDSVSIVDLATRRVVRTLLVGDEPRDIVFAGPNRDRAFITTAHRGQQRQDPSLQAIPGAGSPELTRPGVGRADVWVFDANNLGTTVGGTPLRIVVLFGDTPRALAASPDGNVVYAAIFNSGNQTTTVPQGAVCRGFESAGPCTVDGATMPGGNPGPSTNAVGRPAPEVGLIVRYDNAQAQWRDTLGRSWNGAVRFNLPDLDVFPIDATTLAPAGQPWAHVGTTLFNMAVNPVDGTLYVSNTEARNEVRFEGPGVFGGSTVQGHLAEARISLLTQSGVQWRHLNKHIDYAVRPAPAGTSDHSLATPLDMAVSSDGRTLYVAAFGSSRVGVFPTAALSDDSFDPTALSASYLTVSGGGPAGLALDEPRGRLYVYTRFDNGVSVLDLQTRSERSHLTMYSPEPQAVVQGRPFLYDARLTSSNGEASCASCHVFGDLDQLAWDLGNPDESVTRSPIEILLGGAGQFFSPPINGTGQTADFHPMKGPMTTQTLRGLVNSGAQHWRGDRATGFFGTAPADSNLAFRNFIVAFSGLVGRAQNISPAEMQQFADFALAMTLPPNPNRSLDNSLTAAEARGRSFYVGPRLADGVQGFGFTCDGCHRLDPASGLFGTGTKQSFENETQIFKVPHLRNLYQKVGMFGMIQVPFLLPGDSSPQGDQIRGYGYTHDGSTDTLFRFFHATVFAPTASGGFDGGNAQRRDMEAYMLAFDTDLPPIVGQQVTLRQDNAQAAGPRIDLLLARAQTPFVSKILGDNARECEVVAKVRVGERVRGYWLDPQGRFVPDDNSAVLSDAELRRLTTTSPGSEITYTAVPFGAGLRLGVDRNLDNALDGGGELPRPGTSGCSCRVGTAHGDTPAAPWSLAALVLLWTLGRAWRRR